MAFVAAFIVVSMVHEGFHAVTSALYGECSHFVVHPYGFEVVYRTPVELREGFRWFIISGAGNVATPLLGYLLLRSIDALRRLPPALGACAYWLTLMLLVADPLNLSLGFFGAVSLRRGRLRRRLGARGACVPGSGDRLHGLSLEQGAGGHEAAARLRRGDQSPVVCALVQEERAAVVISGRNRVTGAGIKVAPSLPRQSRLNNPV